MASAYFGINLGGDYSPDLVASSATTTNSTDVEIRIDLTKLAASGVRVQDVQLAVDAIMRWINDSRETILGL